MTPVLIVDDEDPIRLLVGRWLTEAGYPCSEADSADAALTSMAANAAPVVFCDVQMPGHDGLWLTRQLRATYPTTAVILATGVETVPPRVSMQSGVLAYLVKPFRRDALLEALRQALEWHESAAASGPSALDSKQFDDWLSSFE